MADIMPYANQTNPRDLLDAVKMIGSAFPRNAWTKATEAVYVMALIDEGVGAAVVRQAIRALIREEEELPSPARVIRRCREVAAGDEFHDWHCPECGSVRVVGTIGGPGWCPDCDWDGSF
jgi:predicted RNA-binding Zn-ribbon protein involved in translation (DUF1610 family)